VRVKRKLEDALAARAKALEDAENDGRHFRHCNKKRN